MNGIDPRGLIKLYGAWCGPDFTGGFSKPYNELDNVERAAALPPVDGLDQCCQSHDKEYASCREKYPCDAEARKKCFKEQDRKLSSCAGNSSGGNSAQALLFGNPKNRIQQFMQESNPGAGPNSESCTCQ